MQCLQCVLLVAVRCWLHRPRFATISTCTNGKLWRWCSCLPAHPKQYTAASIRQQGRFMSGIWFVPLACNHQQILASPWSLGCTRLTGTCREGGCIAIHLSTRAPCFDIQLLPLFQLCTGNDHRSHSPPHGWSVVSIDSVWPLFGRLAWHGCPAPFTRPTLFTSHCCCCPTTPRITLLLLPHHPSPPRPRPSPPSHLTLNLY